MCVASVTMKVKKMYDIIFLNNVWNLVFYTYFTFIGNS
jgi:hypothetical protein